MKRIIGLSIMAIPLIGFIACQPNKSQRVEELEKTFDRAMISEDYVTAITCMNEIITVEGKSIERFDTLAAIYMKAGLYKPAIYALEQVMNKENNDEKNLMTLIKATEALKDYESAAGYYKILVERNPEKVDYLYNWGLSYFHADQYQNSVFTMQKVLQMPQAATTAVTISTKGGTDTVSYKAAAFNIIGFSLLKANELNGAEGAFADALKEAPNFTLAKNNLRMVKELKKEGDN